MAPRLQAPDHVVLGGKQVPLEVVRRKGAVNLTLRFEPASDSVRLVMPYRVPLSEGLDFIESRHDWLLSHMNRLPPRIVFEDGVWVPLLGELHQVRHAPQARRGVWIENGEIHVSGTSEHFARRLSDFLKERARHEIARIAREKAGSVNARVGRLSLKDTKGRWGSCTPYGDLSFSWRLVLAPPFVLDYVVAHEVAHIKELNHGPRFWRLVAALTPHMAEAKTWLRRHGAGLHRYG